MTFEATYLGSNGWLIKFKKTNLIIDPWLKGDLIFPPGEWFFKGALDKDILIEEEINIQKILSNASKHWDGGYVMCGLLGHGDAFALRDPSGIRPAYYYCDDEIVVVASERPVIQTAFNINEKEIKEIDRGNALIIKKNGNVSLKQVLKPLPRKACSFERIYFSRGNDQDIYNERLNLGRQIFKKVLDAIDKDMKNTVFSYIPNTAEVSYFGMMQDCLLYTSDAADE